MSNKSRNTRLIGIVLVFIASAIVTGLATLTPMSHDDANVIFDQLNQSVNSMKESGSVVQGIFGNNLLITVIMFMPIIGPILGFYIFYNTGAVIGAASIVHGFNPMAVFISLWLTPIAWLEFAAYSTAIVASLWLTWRMFHGDFRHELVNTSKFLSVCTLILLFGAIIEAMMI